MHAEALAGKPCTERHRNRRVDVGIAAGQRRTHVVQQPDIGREADDRAKHQQVRECGESRVRRQRMHALAERQADHAHHHSAADHLRRRSHERRRQVATAAPDRAERPRQRRHQQSEQAARLSAQAAAGIEPSHAEKTNAQANPLKLVWPLAAYRREHAHPQRRRRHRYRRDAGGHGFFREVDHAIAEHQQQHAHHRHIAPLRASRQRHAAPAQHREHQRAGNGEAQAAEQERRKPALQCEADPQVGRSPDQVKQGQRECHARAGAASRVVRALHRDCPRALHSVVDPSLALGVQDNPIPRKHGGRRNGARRSMHVAWLNPPSGRHYAIPATPVRTIWNPHQVARSHHPGSPRIRATTDR